ncbi:hypothetical protein [Thalassotalea agarivorans]|uniref:hypothetical protein n=1 Tax=Thalassotalea agarivorans TaxID=349064 RepID=UPI00115FC4E0|nr:hypothetical protein [Thalassotalea agarivorans]
MRFIIVTLIIALVGCSAQSNLTEQHALASDFEQIAHCHFVDESGTAFESVCGLSSEAMIVHLNDDLTTNKRDKSRFFSFDQISAIDLQAAGDKPAFVLSLASGDVLVSLTLNEQDVDSAVTKQWYEYIVASGVKDVTAP